MDRIAEHLETVGDPLSLVAAVAAFFVVFLFMPRRIQLPAALVLMPVVLTIGRLPEIGPAASLCKVCGGGTFVLVAIGAMSRPGNRIRTPLSAYVWLIVAAALIVYVRGAADRTLAVVVQLQWLALVFAAVQTARTVTDEHSLREILFALFTGLGISCLITFSPLMLDPMSAIHQGFGRFYPYGCNPNQIGVMFAVTAGLGLYLSQTCKSSMARSCCVLITALAFGQVVITVSRAAMFLFALFAMPSLFALFRRPIFGVLATGVLVVGLIAVAGVSEDTSFERMDRGLDRIEYWRAMLEEVRQRPLSGLLFTSGLDAIDTEENAHNAYIVVLYLGGLSLAIPLFSVQLYGCWRAVCAWWEPRRVPIDPLLTSVLVAMSLGQLAHGFVNEVIYYPTYTWAFLTVLVPCFFMSVDSLVAKPEEEASLPEVESGDLCTAHLSPTEPTA